VRSLIPLRRLLVLAACFVTSAIGLEGQTTNSQAGAAGWPAAAKPGAATAAPPATQTPTPSGPPAAPAGRGAGLAPTAPQAPEEGMAEYPVPPDGFNVERESVPHGEVKLAEYDSKTLGTRRPVRVYTPPGYSADRKYPVLYLQHGLGNTSTEWTQRARAPIIADNLLSDGKMLQSDSFAELGLGYAISPGVHHVVAQWWCRAIEAGTNRAGVGAAESTIRSRRGPNGPSRLAVNHAGRRAWSHRCACCRYP
jgi:hypothetical protein